MHILAWEQADLTPGGLTVDADEGISVRDTRTSALVLLLAAIEGPVVPAIYDALATAIDRSILHERLLCAYREGLEAYHERGSTAWPQRWYLGACTRLGATATVPTLLNVVGLPGGGWDANIAEGFNVFILLQKLAEAGGTDSGAGPSTPPTKSFDAAAAAAARAFFERHTMRVEIVSAVGALERFYFPRPIESFHLSSASRQAWEWDVDRTSSQAKLDGLIGASDAFIHEMTHLTRLSQIPLLSLIVPQFDLIRTISLLLAFAINVLLLFSYGVSEASIPDGYDFSVMQGNVTLTSEARLPLEVLGAAQTLTSTLILLVFFVKFGPLIARARCVLHCLQGLRYSYHT